MKIAFIVDTPSASGGNFVIFQHGWYVVKTLSWEVTIIVTGVKEISSEIQKTWSHASFISLKEARRKKFDFALATFWNTVRFLKDINASYYAYFVQGLESDFYPIREHRLRKLSNDTYATPLPLITVADWLKKYFEKHYESKVWLVRNGINKQLFNSKKTSPYPEAKGLRVLIEGNINSELKNVHRAIELCKKSKTDEIWLLSLSKPKQVEGIQKSFFNIAHNKVADIYRSSDVMVKLSLTEGASTSLMEFLHCGGTAITSDIPSFREQIIQGQNGYLVPLSDDNNVTQYLNDLRNNKKLLNKLKTGALATVKHWDSINMSSKNFSKTLLEVKKKYSLFNNQSIKKYSQQLFEEYEITFQDVIKKVEINRQKGLFYFSQMKKMEAITNKTKVELKKLQQQLATNNK